MTISYLGAGILVGLSSDTKPTNVPDNSLFIETDKLALWILISGTWYQFAGGEIKLTGIISSILDVTTDEITATASITSSVSWSP